MNRRGFLSRLTRAAAIAVTAPVILREVICRELPVVEPDPVAAAYWVSTTRTAFATDPEYAAWWGRLRANIDPLGP